MGNKEQLEIEQLELENAKLQHETSKTLLFAKFFGAYLGGAAVVFSAMLGAVNLGRAVGESRQERVNKEQADLTAAFSKLASDHEQVFASGVYELMHHARSSLDDSFIVRLRLAIAFNPGSRQSRKDLDKELSEQVSDGYFYHFSGFPPQPITGARVTLLIGLIDQLPIEHRVCLLRTILPNPYFGSERVAALPKIEAIEGSKQIWKDAFAESRTNKMREVIVSSLARDGSDDALRLLHSWAIGTDDFVSSLAISALRYSTTEVALTEIRKLLANDQVHVQCRALQTLATIGPDGCSLFDRVLEMCESGSLRIVEEAIRALSEIRPKASIAVPVFKKHLHGTSDRARDICISALSNYGSEATSAEDDLRELCDDAFIRFDVDRCLEKMGLLKCEQSETPQSENSENVKGNGSGRAN